MKNIKEVYIHLTGDVYAKYEVSTEPRGASENTQAVFVTLDRDSKEVLAMFDEGLVCFPSRGGFQRESDKEYFPHFNGNGSYTTEGVVKMVSSITEFLSEVAIEVWEGVDPRCSAKIPSRLYHRVADICADALTHLGIPAKVTKVALDPEKNCGLRNQYRVLVDVKTPILPWKVESVQDEKNPKRMKKRTIPAWRQVCFDFDPCNTLRLGWIAPNGRHIMGDDARVFRDGKPAHWVGYIGRVARFGPSTFSVSHHSDSVGDTLGLIELMLAQTSILDTCDVNPDASLEEKLAAIKSATASEAIIV